MSQQCEGPREPIVEQSAGLAADPAAAGGSSRKPRVVIVTGMSGAGRRSVLHVLEDLGWFVVDNLPPEMLPELVQVSAQDKVGRLAVGLDVRSRSGFDKLPTVRAQLAAEGVDPEVLFLEANDQAIVRRQESVRRPLPMQLDGTLLQGIARERRMLAELRAEADIVMDTSDTTVHQLAQRVINIYSAEPDTRLTLQVMSFGFKNGVPIDADLVFDVRFLPNPHWVPELRPQTGLSQAVSGYVLAQPGAPEWLDLIESLLVTMEPGYLREHKRQATVAVGCTGGKHRSTAMAEALAKRLRGKDLNVTVLHRDLGRE